MNLKTSLILALIFLVLGTVAVFDPLGWKEKKEEAKEKSVKVLWLKDDKIEWLALNANNVRVRMECANEVACNFDSQGAWSITEPAKDLGDSANIGSFLSSMKNLTAVEQVDRFI